MPREKRERVPNPFKYPRKPHCRVHGPQGHKSYPAYKQWLRDEFEFRCVYCLTREMWSGDGQNRFSIDHVQPKSLHAKLTCDYDNLVYACIRCNTFKNAATDLPDPCKVPLHKHMKLLPSGKFVGLTVEGKRWVEYLGLNRPERVDDRWKQLYFFQKQKDQDVKFLLAQFGYPFDLPDLSKFKPPKGNSRPDGIKTSHYVRRLQKKLRSYY